MEDYELDALKRITTRPPLKYRTLDVTPLTPVIGAEVEGVDLSRDLTEEQLTEIRKAFLHHHVLVFRRQHIEFEDQKRFAAHFGELRPVNPPPEGDPYLLEIRTDSGANNVAGNGWHADGSADAEPSLGSMLHILRTPEGDAGGDTLFANMHLAYDMLSPTLRTMLDGLTAIHDGGLSLKGYTMPPDYVVPVAEHPLVVRHPETGRRLLYVNPAYTDRIPQLSADESRALLDLLFKVVAQRPMLACRVRWEPETLVFWDNRCVQHHAVYDYHPRTRYGRRVAINGGPLRA